MNDSVKMIEVKNLTKIYGTIKALDGVSFHVNKGEVLGFLGPNGAGKTTTMKILTCFIAPTKGKALIAGMDIFENSLEVRRKIGYLPENAPLYSDMRVFEYLDFVGEIRGMPSAKRLKAADKVIGECGLEQVVNQEIRTLSKGFRQRTGLAQAMIHNPEILILDEPTSGLDPNQIVDIRELIKSIGEKRTVVLSTHHLAEVQATAGRVIIINKGKLVADGSPQELEQQRGGAVYTLTLDAVEAKQEDVKRTIKSIDNVENVIVKLKSSANEIELVVYCKGDFDIREQLFKIVIDHGWTLLEMGRKQVDLEGIFRGLTLSSSSSSNSTYSSSNTDSFKDDTLKKSQPTASSDKKSSKGEVA